MYDTIGEIDARLAEIRQLKAERKAMRGYRDAAYYDYIVKGDRSGFDRIDADEAAYRNMLAQQKYNSSERALDRDLSRELAYNSQSNNPNLMNDIANKYDLANTDYELALQTFNPDDPASVANLKRKAQMLNHYGSQLGFEPVSLEAPTSRPKTGVEEQKDSEGVARELLKKKDWTDEDRDKAIELKDNVKDETIKAQLETLIANKGKTKEDKDRELADAIASWEKSGRRINPDPSKYKVKLKDNKPYKLVRK